MSKKCTEPCPIVPLDEELAGRVGRARIRGGHSSARDQAEEAFRPDTRTGASTRSRTRDVIRNDDDLRQAPSGLDVTRTYDIVTRHSYGVLGAFSIDFGRLPLA
jgi:hypothetical protein